MALREEALTQVKQKMMRKSGQLLLLDWPKKAHNQTPLLINSKRPLATNNCPKKSQKKTQLSPNLKKLLITKNDASRMSALVRL